MVTISYTKITHLYIFMADNNQYENPPKNNQKWYLLPFFGTFCETRSLKFGKKKLGEIWQKSSCTRQNMAEYFSTSSHKPFVPNFLLKKFVESAEISAHLWAKPPKTFFEVNFFFILT